MVELITRATDATAVLSYAAAIACYVFAATGCLYALVAAYCARNFARSSDVKPAPANYAPVTILKPLHGFEPGLYDNLEGFCTQDYPQAVQIIFGVADAADPAVVVVRKLIADFADRDLVLTIDPRRHGANAKVSNLINMMKQARHDILVLSDSDIAVQRNYLRDVVASLERPDTGLVTCLYRGAAGAGAWSRLAAAWIDYHFLPSVLVGLKFGLAAPCFGSTMALRRQTLDRIGGFEAVADELADDYALGALVRRSGLTVALPAMTVTHVCCERSAAELFRHELRWARTVRAVDPRGYAGLVLTHPLPFALLGLLFGAVTPAAIIVAAALACRFVLVFVVNRAFRMGNGMFRMGPIRDLLSFVVFVASFFGRDVEWRGQRYGLRPDAKLVSYGEAKS